MFEAADVGRAIGTGEIMDGNLDDLQIQFRRTEDQIEITEGIEIAEVRAVGGDLIVVGAVKDFGAAECVLEPLVEQVGEGKTEELVAQDVEKTHRLVLHRVHES